MWVTLIDFLMLKHLCLHGERYLLMIPDSIYSYFIEDFFYRISLYSWPLNNIRVKDVNPYSWFSFLMLHRLLKIMPHFGWLSVWTKIFFSPMVIVYLWALNCPCLLHQIFFFLIRVSSFFQLYVVLVIVYFFSSGSFTPYWAG